ncbi:MAG TPA: cytochrome c3 family protein [Bryobacteraceae bacterium]|nr:cytochrome c3 family protein [Bryobacteraceae bacterium]
MKLKCVYCHTTAETAERATFPAALKCKTCHTTMDLASDAKVTPAKPVYVLPDFVFFSHAKHAAAKVGCENCHGDVWKQATMKPVLPMKMGACVDCHKARKATIACNKCHELSQ